MNSADYLLQLGFLWLYLVLFYFDLEYSLTDFNDVIE